MLIYSFQSFQEHDAVSPDDLREKRKEKGGEGRRREEKGEKGRDREEGYSSRAPMYEYN